MELDKNIPRKVTQQPVNILCELRKIFESSRQPRCDQSEINKSDFDFNFGSSDTTFGRRRDIFVTTLNTVTHGYLDTTTAAV